jgi:hypothetical protein
MLVSVNAVMGKCMGTVSWHGKPFLSRVSVAVVGEPAKSLNTRSLPLNHEEEGNESLVHDS